MRNICSSLFYHEDSLFRISLLNPFIFKSQLLVFLHIFIASPNNHQLIFIHTNILMFGGYVPIISSTLYIQILKYIHFCSFSYSNYFHATRLKSNVISFYKISPGIRETIIQSFCLLQNLTILYHICDTIFYYNHLHIHFPSYTIIFSI